MKKKNGKKNNNHTKNNLQEKIDKIDYKVCDI